MSWQLAVSVPPDPGEASELGVIVRTGGDSPACSATLRTRGLKQQPGGQCEPGTATTKNEK